MKTTYNCNRKKEEDCIVKVKSRQKQPPHVIASLPHGVSEEDVVFLAWISNFGTRYRVNQYVVMERMEGGFEDDFVMGRIEARLIFCPILWSQTESPDSVALSFLIGIVEFFPKSLQFFLNILDICQK